MPTSRAALILPLLLVAALRPAPAAAATFTASWTLANWAYVQEVGNTDGDPQKELLFRSRTDNHFALVDGLTGVIAKEFPDFSADNTQFSATDVDNDGRLELFFWRPSPPLVTGYDWNGTTYATLFSHTDPVDQQWGLAIFRNGIYDALEVSNNDVRVRDLSGTVLFRASNQVAAWTGTGVSVFLADMDQNGIQELGVIQKQFSSGVRLDFFRYIVGFSTMWSVAGWQPFGTAKTDSDSQLEILMVNGADGHYALFDGMNGAMEMDFPGFSIYQNGSLTAADVGGTGPQRVILSRDENPPTTTRQFVSYEHNGSTYVQNFSHSDRVDGWTLSYLRQATVPEFLETSLLTGATDFRVRDLGGNVLFTASAGIPGWTGATLNYVEIDADLDGVRELLVQDGNVLRFVRWSGSAFTQLWSTTAWDLQAVLGNVDGDPQPELLVTSAGDHHYALMNAVNGTIEQQFPSFNSDTSFLLSQDVDGDGRLELIFSPLGIGPTLTTAYDWVPSGGWTPLFSHNDPIEGLGSGHFRTATATDLGEFASADLRVRDMSGYVLFRASTDLTGWTGVDRSMEVVDVNGDGVDEILASDAGHVWLVRNAPFTGVVDPVGRGFQVSNSPNPFRVGTAFRISTTAPGPVGIRVVDASGRLVRRIDEHRIAGTHEIHWDGKDEQGRAVPAGILFYEVTAGADRKTGRLVRLGP